MKKYVVIPLRSRSFTDDFLSADGEVASATNLFPLSSDATSLPSMPELPHIEVSLLRSVLPGWQVNHNEFPAKDVVSTDTSSEARAKCSLLLLNQFNNDAADRNLFTQPFLLLAAFRLKDGRHISPTPPILLIPNSKAPVISLSGEGEEIRLAITAAVCRLQYRITMPESADYSDLSIASLDLFISTPFHLYDSETPPLSMRHISYSGFSHSLSPSTGKAGEELVASTPIPSGYLPKSVSEGEIAFRIASADSFHKISSIPFKSLDSFLTFRDVDFNCGSPLSSPHPPYTPDYLQLSTVESSELGGWEGSTPFINLRVAPPSPLPLKYLTPYTTTEGYIPRFLFHPDSCATLYTFTREGKGCVLPLQKHPRLYGSYLLRSLDPEGEYITDTNPDPYIPASHIERRELTTGLKLSPGEKTLFTSTGGEVSLTLRPLKFTTPGSPLRLHSIGIRGNYTPGTLRLQLEGSRNLKNWHEIAATTSGDISRIFNARFPFYRLTVRGVLEPGESISAIVASTGE